MKAQGLGWALGLWLLSSVAAAEGGAHGGHHGELHFIDVIAGPDGVHFWGSLINWGLLVLLFVKYGAKPLHDMLGTRRREMEVAIREASAAKAAAEARQAEYAARITHLDQELAQLRADIERAAQDDRERILADAQHASARLKEDTETLVRQHAEALARQVRREVVDAAVAAAERTLRESIHTDDQRRLADTYRDEVARSRAARGQA